MRSNALRRSALLTAVVAVGAWAPAGVTAQDSGPTVPLTIFMSPEGLFGEITGETYSNKLLADATNTTLEVIRGDMATENEKIGTILASGDLPDVLTWWNGTWANDYGPRGLFVRLDEQLAAGKMPNLQAEIERRGTPMEDLVAGDGHIYNAPRYSDVTFINPALLMRADLLQACGTIGDKNDPGPPNVIGDTEQLHAAFVCLQEQLGGGPVIGARDGVANAAPKWASWFGSSVRQYFNPATGTFEYGPLMDRYRTMLTFYHQLYAEGLLHPDYATLTDAEWSGIHDSGAGGAALENAGWNYNRLRDIGIDPGKDFFVQSLTIDGERVLWPAPSPLLVNGGLAISARSSQEEIDAAVRLVDHLYSEEGAQAIAYGQEGVDWQVGADGKACFLGTILYRPHAHGYCSGAVPEGTPSFVETCLLDCNTLYRIAGYGWQDKWSGVDNPDVAPDRWNEVVSQFVDGGSLADPLPVVALNQDEVGVVAQFGTPLDTYVLEETQKFIEGSRELSDAEWESFKATVSDLGAQQVVDAYNAALAR